MQNRSRPTSGAIGGLREGCSDGPRRRQGLRSGDRRRRASSARGPSPTSFGVLGLTRARQSFLWPDKSGWRGGGEAIEDVLSECAPHPAHAPYLTHACARATQVPASCNHRCSTGGALRRRESSRERRGGDGAAPRAAAAARLGERTWATAATCMAHCLACSGETHRHDRAGPARHEGPVLPSRDVNRTQLRAGLQTTSSPVYLPLSLPPSPILSLPDAGRSRADFLFGVRVALIGRDRPSTSHLLLLRGHVGQHPMTCHL